MPHDYVICVRDVENGKFISEPGKTRYLLVPESSPDDTTDLPLSPSQTVKRDDWLKALLAEVNARLDSAMPTDFGDILVFIHGYNNPQKIVMQRHRQLKSDLKKAGFAGVVVSFDWPSADFALNYLEDREDAQATALALIKDAIRLFALARTPDCRINVHLLAHSTGAYVIQEAFRGANHHNYLNEKTWMVSQILFIGADIPAASLAKGDADSEAIYEHCVRLTNYSNPADSVLKLSNMKRLGMEPRLGRDGLPKDAPASAVNVNCASYFYTLDEQNAKHFGTFCHSWHIGDPIWTEDVIATLKGDLGRHELDIQPAATFTPVEAEDGFSTGNAPACRGLRAARRGIRLAPW